MENVTNEIAVSHIKKYFEASANGRPTYTGSRFETFAGGGDVVEPNRITAADLIAVSTLSVHVPGQAALGIIEELDGEIERLLVQVPNDVRLEDLNEEEFKKFLDDGSPTDCIWQLLRQRRDVWGIGPTTTSKILARKRPHLVPIYDSVIANQVGMRDSGRQWRRWWHAFQGDEGRKLSQRLDTIRTGSGQTHLSLLRVLDIVLWMEGHGAEKTRETVGDGA
ncbi:DUF6308 family protein [Arthrobacter wenxiniae]|uniref:Uncharacterized protein n=1 Tax=Arthrobacter wenxiniae TaxID=2713570 RepID=A0A7Y7M0X3_9MICC|nr:DUF6308 family protein [Arthrobacter wenxiniae]NVM96173.1 hypothetical protein [Arthrobacter wenxiniae]